MHWSSAKKTHELFLAFYNASLGDLYLARAPIQRTSSPNTDPLWSVHAIDTEGHVGSWLDMIIDDSGQPIIAYYDYDKGDLKAAFLGEQKIYTIDSESNVGMDISLTQGSDGVVYVSYSDLESFSLKAARIEGDKITTKQLDNVGVYRLFLLSPRWCRMNTSSCITFPTITMP